jgi:MFS family permease
MKKVNRTLLKIAILCIAIQDIGAGAASPALASIMKDFPMVPPSTVMMIATIPSICMVIFSLVYGKAAKHYRKRSIFMFGAACFLIGGVTPAFLDNIYAILAMRFIFGIGIGLFYPMSIDITIDFFEGRERDTMMGLGSAMASAGGMMFQMLGGYLANIDWHYCFFAYLVSVIMFMAVIFWLPEPPKKAPAEGIGEKVKLPSFVYIYAIFILLYEAFVFSIVTNNAVVIVGEGLGSPVQVGYSLTLFTAGSFVAGLMFATIRKVFKDKTITFSFLLSAIGFFVCLIPNSLTMVILGTTVVGFGIGFAMVAVIAKLSSMVYPNMTTTLTSRLIFFVGLGQFLQPIVFAGIERAFHQGPGRFAFLVSAVVITGIAIIMAASEKPLAGKTLIPPSPRQQEEEKITL